MTDLKALRYTLITTAVGALMMPAAALAQSDAAERAREGSIHGQDSSHADMDREYREWRDQQAQRLDRGYETWASERADRFRGDMPSTAERAREGTIHGQDSFGDKYSRAELDREYEEWREQQMERLDREYETWSSDRFSARDPATGLGVEPTQTGAGATTGNFGAEPVTGTEKK